MADNGKRAPKVTVQRLSQYLSALERFHDKGLETISSEDLAGELNLKPSQLRKDLAFFGEFGTRGMGYNVPRLAEALRRILGLHRQWAIAIIGVGNLGTALLRYRGLNEKGFRVAALFDDDPEKVGSSRSGIIIHHVDKLAEVFKDKNIQIAILTVPAPAARTIADAVVGAGCRAILNFAPVSIKVPPEVEYLQVDIASELKTLSHFLATLDYQHADEPDIESATETASIAESPQDTAETASG
ncbi:MAG TPA: redox-sensing transcriptional repressor Rex [Firmicutes bacterium]|nr:redox-sensing transcriptional repressor Rex [Bacillota bacterium]